MIDYRCPDSGCNRKLLEADAPIPVRVTVKCPRCREIVEPVRGDEVWHRTYQCSECGRTQHVERPDRERAYCVACGKETLKVESERRMSRSTSSPETVPVSR